MSADTVKLSYVPVINWSESSQDFVSLLHAADEGENDYYASYRFRGSRNYLARQAFLRSYKFSIEESFKDRFRRSVRRLNEESEELLKDSLRKLKRNTKSFVKRCHCEVPLANRIRQDEFMTLFLFQFFRKTCCFTACSEPLLPLKK